MIKQFRDTDYYCTPYGEIYRKKGYGFRLCKPSSDKEGYPVLSIFFNGKYRVMKSYRVIYESWCGPIPIEMTIDHIDFNIKNQNVSNLQILTRSQNSSKKRRSLSGTLSPCSKVDSCTARMIAGLTGNINISQLSRETGVPRQTIQRIRSGASYSHDTRGIP